MYSVEHTGKNLIKPVFQLEIIETATDFYTAESKLDYQ